MKAVEPSEIIIDKQGLPREDTTHVNPWVRFLARFFDYALFFSVLWGLRAFFNGHSPLGKMESLIPFEFFVWIPFEALFFSTWGTTPGKFFLKTEIKQGRKEKLDYFTALKRSFNVWFRGLGMGIPVINFFCLLIAYQRLRVTGKTSWDRDENFKVSHRPVARWRLFAAAIVAVGGLYLYFSNKTTL